MHSTIKNWLWLGASALALTAPAATHAQATQGSAPADAQIVQEVVVTAEKRTTNVQSVPVSITAFTSENLRARNITSGIELAHQVPSLVVSNLGNEDQPKFSMRGLGTPDFNLNTTSPTGVFYDEIYVASQFLGGPQIFDLERVEVLRGPQGTLFGKNTTAGAINFIAHRPNLSQTEGYLGLGVGNNDQFSSNGALNLPLIEDKLALRVAFDQARSDGWIKNHNPAPEAQDLSSVDKVAVRATLLYKPTDDFDASLRATWSRSHPTNVGSLVFANGDPNNPNGNVPDGLSGVNGLGIYPRKDPATGRQYNNFEGYYDRVGGYIHADGQGLALTMNKRFDGLTLTSISSYLKGSFANLVDADGSISDLIPIDFYADTREWSQDLRIASDDSRRFKYILGLYYFHDEIGIQTDYFFFNHSGQLLQSYDQERTSYAAYADVKYDLTDTTRFYGGVRWTKDKGNITNFQVIPTIPLDNSIPKRYDDSAPTGRIGMQHDFAPRVMGYAQYSRGYRSSAANGSALNNRDELNFAKPEYLDAYEAGLKSRWFDQRLQLNGAVFFYNYKSQQFVNAQSITTSALVNAGGSHLYGLELEATARPTQALTLNAGLSLLHAEYTSLHLVGFDPATRTSHDFDLKGNRLPEAPKVTFNYSVDYRRPVAEGLELFVQQSGNYVSKQYYSPFNDLNYNFVRTTPGHWNFDGKIGVKSLAHNYEISVWGKNLGNDDTLAGWGGGDINTFKHFFAVGPYPRRYGVEVRYSF